MKRQSDIDWIFFDVGGVITDNFEFEKWRVESILSVLSKFDHKITEDKVKETIIKLGDELGSLTRNTIRFLLKDREEVISQAEEEVKILQDNFKDLSPVRPEALKVISQLSEDYFLGIIANQPSGIREKLDRAGVLKYFKNLGISEECDLHKPDPRFFKKVLSESGATADRSIMIDDNIERSLVPANELGMNTVWYDLGARKEVPDWVDFRIKNLEDLLLIF